MTLDVMLNEREWRKEHRPGWLLLVSAAAMILTDLLNAIATSYSHGTPFAASLWLMARELLLSLPVAMLVHLAFSRVHRRFAGR